jgi:hypothetical protein
MKNQYFADINDYRKYGILRLLVGKGEKKAAICWMLTEDDKSSDGKFTNYIKQPDKWRIYDTTLFDSLAACLENQENRSVEWAEKNNLIPSAVYFSELLRDEKEKRKEYFEKFKQIAAESDFVFFDPDNGIEVKSVPYGRRKSKKYLYWREITDTFSMGKSLLIYQHFIRKKRDVFIQELADKFKEYLGTRNIFALRTAHVVFLLVPQYQHIDYFGEKSKEISAKWKSQIRVSTRLVA